MIRSVTGIPLLKELQVKARRTLVSFKEAKVNRVFVRRTFLATPKGNDVRCKTTSPFARSRHYISDSKFFLLINR